MMGISIKCMLYLCIFIFGLVCIQGYDSRKNHKKIEILEIKLNAVSKELDFMKEELNKDIKTGVDSVSSPSRPKWYKNLRKRLDKQIKNDLKEEQERIESKFTTLEENLIALIDSKLKGTHQKKEFDTATNYPEQRVYNALYDEKQQRKRFETQIKNHFQNERKHMSIKITSLNETFSAHIDTQLKTFEDGFLHSVTALNDSNAYIKDLTSTVKQNDKTITTLMLQSDQQNTKLMRQDAMIGALEDSLVDVKSSIVELNDNCHYKGWSGWSSWSTCSKSCGVSQQTSTRTCRSTNTLLSGKCCIGSHIKTQVCTLRPCPEWSGWSNWSSCSSSCGVGQQKSTRRCSYTNTPLSGSSCIGSNTKTQVCSLRSCPEWSGWSRWSSCSSSCGVGQQKSTRRCSYTNTPLSGSSCIGSNTKTQVCSLRSCPGPKDCLEVLNENKNNANGVYNVRSPSSGLVYPVYCDMTTDGGGWTVLQKRFDGSVDFYRTFKEYEDGFGDVNAEFWMGLKHIHDMTAMHTTELRIDLADADGTTAFMTYQNFSVSPEPDYKLHIGQAAGTAGDDGGGLTWSNGYGFSTKDKDVDTNTRGQCTKERHGAWWYINCTNVNLNGHYATPGTQSAYGLAAGVVYHSFRGTKSLKTTTMMFRRKRI